MNIFVTNQCPIQSARNLPDKHIVKMPLETCQMLSIIYSDWYYGIGQLHKVDGTPYATKKWCISQPPLHTMGCRRILESIMAHITRHGFVRRVHSSLSQASRLSACYCRSHYHIRGCLRLQCRHIQGRSTHDIYTCHARVTQVRHYYRHYYSVQTLPQHQAVAS